VIAEEDFDVLVFCRLDFHGRSGNLTDFFFLLFVLGRLQVLNIARYGEHTHAELPLALKR
jgi:hypothetical protein